ncbi:kinase-like domain-containing protein [Thelephora terrestris]|uniref:Kinase-like domain-containing protein n=1 Tax=Thelephora terrestris TaxID=56493 RepID=A0A9P6HK23_9AGAM|nr:kinase-like domain-containing protein [Thelephora terrestris]
MEAPNTTGELVRNFARGKVTQGNVPRALPTIFDAPDYTSTIQGLSKEDLKMWVDRLDQAIDSGDFAEELRKRSLRALRKTCGAMSILPTSHYFQARLYKTSNRPMTGGTADVWRVEDDQKKLYAAKAFRVYNNEEYKIKRYHKEVVVWKRLNHPNVLPAFGASRDIAEFCVVSPWMPEGDILHYVNKYPGADRALIMIGVAEGISYLHSNNVIHGDLKGPNILFDNTGVPKITDFGVSSITLNIHTNNASTPNSGFSMRWTAPEILEPPNNDPIRPTKASDVYAFAMVVIEIFTGKHPFPEESDQNVYLMVTKGKRPSKPAGASKSGLSSAGWKIVEDCWNKKRDKRPDMQAVVNRLRKA